MDNSGSIALEETEKVACFLLQGDALLAGDAVHLRHVRGPGQEAQRGPQGEGWQHLPKNRHQRGRRSHRERVHQGLLGRQGGF